MNIISACGMSVSKDLENLPISGDLSECCEVTAAGPFAHTTKTTGDFFLDDLGACLPELASAQDLQKFKSCSLGCSGDEDTMKNGQGTCGKSTHTVLETVASKKSLTKSATFPSLSATSIDEDGEEAMNDEVVLETGSTKSARQHCTRSISLPTPRKLVSAMKGSREKQGMPPVKLSVKWAPDVYDPQPSAVSHAPSSRIQRQRTDSRKSGKNKCRGGGRSSRSGKGKDKKQSKKQAGSSNRVYKSKEEDTKAIAGKREPVADVVDYSIGSPDPFCGHSFLKKSVTELHFPVAEAS